MFFHVGSTWCLADPAGHIVTVLQQQTQSGQLKLLGSVLVYLHVCVCACVCTYHPGVMCSHMAVKPNDAVLLWFLCLTSSVWHQPDAEC
jgi:hypothetical protein